MYATDPEPGPIGILMLDTKFPRIPGDMGNPATWDFPVLFRTVPRASPDRIVRGDPLALLPAFIEAARALEADGAIGITTSCGFLSVAQADLAAAVGIPVLTSALFQVAAINRLLPAGRCAGILTISARSLAPHHLHAAGVPEDTPIGTTEGRRHFTEAILGDAETLDVDAARADNVEAALALKARHPEVAAIVLECTNMSPYAAAIRAATGLPVYSMVTLVEWFRASLVPPKWTEA